ncbi:predicted protein [Chaetoceros tenuissimus]|uniref:Uncharacterized protein n=1 Tax=Chaetoceros tenuissimus TaxID=426638 RepID=A0AAD3CDK7_9STRA|nr:predicted protein [Chaetoceros tenuissimus]
MCLSRSSSLIFSDASLIPIQHDRITEDLTKIAERLSKGKDNSCVDTRIQSDTRTQLYMTPKRSPTQVNEYDLSPPPVKRGRLQPRYYEVNEFSSVPAFPEFDDLVFGKTEKIGKQKYILTPRHRIRSEQAFF